MLQLLAVTILDTTFILELLPLAHNITTISRYVCHFVSDATSAWKSSLLTCLSSVFPGNGKVARITSMGFLPCLTHQCWSQLLRRIAKGSGP